MKNMIDLNSKIKHNQFYEKYECFDKSKRGERKKIPDWKFLKTP